MQHDTVVNLSPQELADQQRREGYLRLLSIFHYIVAGCAVLVSLFFAIYLALGGAMLINPEMMAEQGDPPPQFLGCFFLGFGGVAILAAWSYAAFLVYAGRCIARRRRHVLCLVAAGLSCLFQPFGLVLGVFTILVLVQPEVRAMFDRDKAVTAAVEG